ncbi:hypothetical protein [Pyxidicoccus caerfyrddinensis]|uniref:hypothetical protein n=1 Tax=Pyxidicoccus caerfyrddinensis TaxID=2709663 RepID=UPI0013DA4A71|nr:hypothetical protein [Pyxidicoccus caerfyrddinensis]
MLQRKVLAWFLAMGAALLPPDVSEACLTTPPKTLWKLASAETIVLARVPSDSEDRRVVDLQVVERWKGTPGDTLRVRQPPIDFGCAIPPSFPPGETVVAFLMGPVQDIWWGHDFGVFPVKTEDDIAAFRARLKEAIAAQASPLEAPPREWSLLAASQPATRWHGLYHLFGPYNVRFPESLPAPRLPLPKQPLLTKEEQRRIAASFVASPGNPKELGLVLMALQGYPDPAVDRAAVASMDAWLSTAPDSEAVLMPVTLKVLASRLGISVPPPEPGKVIPPGELLELPYPRRRKLFRQYARMQWKFVSTEYRKRARAG